MSKNYIHFGKERILVDRAPIYDNLQYRGIMYKQDVSYEEITEKGDEIYHHLTTPLAIQPTDL